MGSAASIDHEFPDGIGRLYRVRAGQLIHRNDGTRLSVQAAHDAVVLGAEFDASNIPEADDCSARLFANNDLPEFFGRSKATLRTHGVGELLPLRRRLTAHLARRIYGVLRLNRRDNFGNRDGKFG